jgi:hypothetical protein
VISYQTVKSVSVCIKSCLFFQEFESSKAEVADWDRLYADLVATLIRRVDYGELKHIFKAKLLLIKLFVWLVFETLSISVESNALSYLI